MLKKGVKVDKQIRNVTSSGDVVQLLNYKTEKYSHSFTLCKVQMCNILSNIVWVYMLLVDGDDYPIVISKDLAKDILEDPKKGAELVYSCRMNRYR